MRKVILDEVQKGMVLAKHIFSGDGRVLLGAGVTLNANYLDRLHELGVMAVYVQDPCGEKPAIPEILSEETRVRAIQGVKHAFQKVQLSKAIDIRELRKSVVQLVDEVVLHKDIMVHLSDIRSHDDYTFGHSVNVCVLSVLTAIAMGYNELQLRDLALGALLHDVGKMLVPIDILNKPGKLTDEEMVVMRSHSTLGFDYLRQFRKEIAIPIAHVAFQHHEKYDGSGYPRGLKGEDIHEYARIVALADVYDALVADRIYRKGFLPYEAHEILTASYNHFDPAITQVFLSNIAIYPIGSTVQLNTHAIAVVVDVNKEFPTRPVVRLLFDVQGNSIDKYQEIDLTRHLTLFIDKLLCEEEIQELFSKK